ncbi:MAG: hypothetical protein JNL57_05525 [Bacteroidetes bacterium]|nr:hypothetical protein [Bacteroidota bacterium]
MRLVFFLLLLSTQGVYGQEKSRFTPRGFAGFSAFFTHVLEGEVYRTCGLQAGYNFNCLSRKTWNISIEPNVGIGQSVSLENRKQKHTFYDLTACLIARKKLGPLVLGLGYYGGASIIRNDYTYTGYAGATFRVGCAVSRHIFAEAALSAAHGGEEGIGNAGIRLVFSR